MSKNPIELAKKLISDGEKSGNKQLIKMGKDILSKHKKQEFITTTRKPEAKRLVYDENGNVVGQRMVREPIGKIVNTFVDTDRLIGSDKENEILKKYTKRVPRNRNSLELKTVSCYICGKVETVNPIHAAGKFYRCIECAKKIKRT